MVLMNESKKFVPLADGDTIPIIFGGQGLKMITPALRLRQGTVPECIEVMVSATDDGGGRISSTMDAVKTYSLEGAWVTEGIYLPGTSWKETATVTAQAGGQVVSRKLRTCLFNQCSVDGGVDLR